MQHYNIWDTPVVWLVAQCGEYLHVQATCTYGLFHPIISFPYGLISQLCVLDMTIAQVKQYNTILHYNILLCSNVILCLLLIFQTPVLKISLCDISRIIKRRFLLKHVVSVIQKFMKYSQSWQIILIMAHLSS